MTQLRIAENIRRYRKERGLTQERLAELMGVTVGAVSKWESGASTPDLALIVELASFFETSVDVLLGYGWHTGGMGEAVARIKALRNAKRFDEAATEAERAIERYPNSFEVAYAAAILFSLKGVEQGDKKAYRRALTLYERALELVGQNTDEHTNEWSIRNHIAQVYLCLGETDEALTRMKRNNVEGLNDISIGVTLANAERAPEEALPYLADGLTKSLSDRLQLALGYATAYRRQGELPAARAVLAWVVADLEGLRRPDAVSYVDRMLAQLESTGAIMAALAGDWPGARACLLRAKAAAERFDAAPAFDFTGMRFHHGKKGNRGFDSFGATTLEGVGGLLESEEPVAEALLTIWKELCNGKDA